MLQSLSVRNYALISELTVNFNTGLSTITGETGAGKSILMGALSLILGNRADTGVLKEKDKKCVVEGIFATETDLLADLFTRNELDADVQVILRREIVPSGKSRAFVNDTPVTLPVMKEFGDRLVNIHAQHQNLMLNQENFPVLALDGFLLLDQAREAFEQQFSAYTHDLAAYKRLKNDYEEQVRNQDFIEYQLNQLNEARLDDDRMSDLEEEREVLSHAEEIHKTIGEVNFLYEEDERALLSEIKESIKALRTVEGYYAALTEPLNRLDGAYLELKDIISELGSLSARVDIDPARLQLVQDRLDQLYSLEQKHQVSGQDQLIRLRNELQEQVNSIELSNSHLLELAAQLERNFQSLLESGQELSAKRKAGVKDFCDRVENLLSELGMPNARFKIQHTVLDVPKSDGLDQMELLFAANKNQDPEVVSRVASGGEISRLMLSIKALISQSLVVPTLIFDEIDAGVSGEIADKMGQLIRSLADGRQVLNITHLPQVAKSGQYHYQVFKFDDEFTTHTSIKLLNQEERITQLAKMLSGEQVTEAAVENARRLLN